ncbi:Glycos_transf_1 domain-containing protein [Vibrio chagasii]|nr:Glycos_transf_1 domain-containing protein [Vibrio chagasii]
MKKVLVIGNLPGKDKRSIGGATKLLESYIEYLDANSVEYDHLQIRSQWKRFTYLINILNFLVRFIFLFYRYETISIHATRDFSLTLGWVVVLISKVCKKKVLYHVFGGNLHEYHKESNFILKSLLNIIVKKSDFFYVETKRMVSYFCEINESSRIIWLPNCRKSNNIINETKYENRFIFVSRVTRTKGIYELVEAFTILGKDYVLDIYGPVDDSKILSHIENSINSNYKGLLGSKEVYEKLSTYNFHILPTFHDGEGYPGVVIEAMSVGTPSICSDWNCLDEIIINDENGYLIKPKSVESIVEVILKIDPNSFDSLKMKTHKCFKNFSDNFVFKKLEENI